VRVCFAYTGWAKSKPFYCCNNFVYCQLTFICCRIYMFIIGNVSPIRLQYIALYKRVWRIGWLIDWLIDFIYFTVLSRVVNSSVNISISIVNYTCLTGGQMQRCQHTYKTHHNHCINWVTSKKTWRCRGADNDNWVSWKLLLISGIIAWTTDDCRMTTPVWLINYNILLMLTLHK